jgi:hypothetical protein
MLLLLVGCAYTIGSGLTAGVMDEMGGEGRSQGLEGATEDLLEKQILVKLGHQLGQGLGSGVAEIDPEQQARLEQTISDLINVAMRRAGHGLRTEVSPELREMVQKDIVRALSEGMRGELGDSLEQTVDRVVARAVSSLRENLGDDATKLVVSDLIRDSTYYAVREGQITPSIGETIEGTLNENMLGPIQDTFDEMRTALEEAVDDRTQRMQARTENTLRTIIGFLVVAMGVGAMLYFVRGRQAQRLAERSAEAERGLANFDAALEALDPTAREAVLAKLREYQAVTKRPAPAPTPPPPKRSDAYERRKTKPPPAP